MTERKSIAQRDKELMDLQAQIEDKEAQLKQDYQKAQDDMDFDKVNSFKIF